LACAQHSARRQLGKKFDTFARLGNEISNVVRHLVACVVARARTGEHAPMSMTQSILHKTTAGRAAGERADSRLPPDYRTILESVQYATHFNFVAARLPCCSKARIARYLEDLEAIGLIESVQVDWLRELYALGHWERATCAPRAR